MSGKRPNQLKRLRAETKRVLHLQLDTMLNGPSTLPDGSTATVLDDIVVRQFHGYGFAVSIAVRNPDEEGRAVEDPGLSQPKPLIEIVR